MLLFYLVKYQGKYIANYEYKHPENPKGWILVDTTKDEAKKYYKWRSFEVNSFKQSNVELEIEVVTL